MGILDRSDSVWKYWSGEGAVSARAGAFSDASQLHVRTAARLSTRRGGSGLQSGTSVVKRGGLQ